MSEPKIAREVAEAEVQRWCERFDASLDLADRERIVRVLMAGRLSLDESKDEFCYRLRSPVTLENGSKLEELRIGEPSTGMVRDANRTGGKDEFEVSLRLLSYVTHQALGVLDRIGQKDLTSLGMLFNFFG